MGDLKFFVTSDSRKSRMSQSARSSRKQSELTGSRLRMTERSYQHGSEHHTLSQSYRNVREKSDRLLLSPQVQTYRVLSGRPAREDSSAVNRISEYTNSSADETSISTDRDLSYYSDRQNRRKVTA